MTTLTMSEPPATVERGKRQTEIARQAEHDRRDAEHRDGRAAAFARYACAAAAAPEYAARQGRADGRARCAKCPVRRGPTCKIVSAKAGSSAVAPPKSTAKRSSEMRRENDRLSPDEAQPAQRVVQRRRAGRIVYLRPGRPGRPGRPCRPGRAVRASRYAQHRKSSDAQNEQDGRAFEADRRAERHQRPAQRRAATSTRLRIAEYAAEIDTQARSGTSASSIPRSAGAPKARAVPITSNDAKYGQSRSLWANTSPKKTSNAANSPPVAAATIARRSCRSANKPVTRTSNAAGTNSVRPDESKIEHGLDPGRRCPRSKMPRSTGLTLERSGDPCNALYWPPVSRRPFAKLPAPGRVNGA